MSGQRWTAGAAVAALLTLAAGCADPGGVETPLEATGADLASASSTLVECPTNETLSTTGTIGLTGGTIDLGGHAMTLPFGAVLVPTTFTLTAPAGQYVELEIHAGGLDTFLFETPASVTISYDRCTRSNVDQSPLTAWYIDGDTKALLEHMGGTDDKSARAVTFTTDHLSAFAIAN